MKKIKDSIKKVARKIVKRKVAKKKNFYLVYVDEKNPEKRFVKTQYKTKATAEKAAKALAKKKKKMTCVYECEQGDFNWKSVAKTTHKK